MRYSQNCSENFVPPSDPPPPQLPPTFPPTQSPTLPPTQPLPPAAVPPTQPPTQPQPPTNPPALPVDLCINITGQQDTVPAGMVRDSSGNCVTSGTPPSTQDVCLNLPGVQTTIPAGMVRDASGNCVSKESPPSQPPPGPDPEPTGNEGCSHGYWKTHPENWPSPYIPLIQVNSVFAAEPSGITFQEALAYNGGDKAMVLLRNAVGSVLNIAHAEVDYPLTLSELVSKVNTALSGSNADKTDLNDELDRMNNSGCTVSK
ncbi:MAG: hypothetical protein KW793_04355 [Candidatus Doudnabacteria bacterium]|nr:hypothetical protein [Candidatus Doudnabacteria bacterium]